MKNVGNKTLPIKNYLKISKDFLFTTDHDKIIR
jgi:hypothetical protein